MKTENKDKHTLANVSFADPSLAFIAAKKTTTPKPKYAVQYCENVGTPEYRNSLKKKVEVLKKKEKKKVQMTFL